MSKRTKLFIFASCSFAAVVLIAVISPMLLPASMPTSPLNPIELENHLPGSSTWQVTNGARNGEIQAYAGENSIDQGENLHLYVSTSSPSYNIDIYRLGYYDGLGGRLMNSIFDNRGIAQGYYTGENKTPTDCNTCIKTFKDSKGRETDITDAKWKLTNIINFPGTWVSGIYIIKLTESLAGYQWEVPVVLRDDLAKADLVLRIQLILSKLIIIGEELGFTLISEQQVDSGLIMFHLIDHILKTLEQ